MLISVSTPNVEVAGLLQKTWMLITSRCAAAEVQA